MLKKGAQGRCANCSNPDDHSAQKLLTKHSRVIHLKKTKHCSSYKGEITEAPDNLAACGFHADAPD